MSAQFHFAKYALPLHFFLESLEGLIDIVVADENLHAEVLGVGAPFTELVGRSWLNYRHTLPDAAKRLTASKADSRIGTACPVRWCRPLADERQTGRGSESQLEPEAPISSRRLSPSWSCLAQPL